MDEKVIKLLDSYSRAKSPPEILSSMANNFLSQTVKFPSSQRYIIYITVLSFPEKTGAILLRKMLETDYIDLEHIQEEKTLNFDKLPDWAKTLILPTRDV